MKNSILTLLFVLFGVAAAAQNPYVALQGAAACDGGIVISQPRTVLGVDVTVACDRILSGPYARYAQKFLGVRAPLTDKTTWSVTGASIALLDASETLGAAEPAASRQRVVSHAVADDEFTRIQPDKTDMTVPALEEAAHAAANAIFSLRRHRFELITGEAGENVFGEGLKAALDEIARLEQSYLELFLGKRILSTQTRRYTVFPQDDKKQYIVCRFSPAEGLLPESDLSGDMVLLMTEPSEPVATGLAADPKARETVLCRVAAPTLCTVTVAGHEFARTEIPVFEFGRTIRVALARCGK